MPRRGALRRPIYAVVIGSRVVEETSRACDCMLGLYGVVVCEIRSRVLPQTSIRYRTTPTLAGLVPNPRV
jgi:hypothetical protein